MKLGILMDIVSQEIRLLTHRNFVIACYSQLKFCIFMFEISNRKFCATWLDDKNNVRYEIFQKY